MREFEPLMYTQEVMDYVEEMSYITSEEEVEKYYIEPADDQKPYCMADQFQGAIDFEGEYASLTEAAFYRAAYELYMNGGIEYLVEDYVGSSEAEDLDSLLDDMDSGVVSYEYYLEYCMRWDSGFHFLVKDKYTAGNAHDEKDVEDNIKKFGEVKTVDYDLAKAEEALAEM